MSKTSFILFLLLFIVLGVFLVIHYSPAKAILPAINSSLNPSPEVADQTATVLALRPKPVTGQIAQVEVVLNSVTITPTIAQIEIGYDPTVLTLAQITPGTYFNKPKVLLDSSIPRTGRLTYAITCSEENHCINDATNAVIATIAYSVSPFAQKKTTQVDILPKTLLRGTNDQEILVQLKGTNVTLSSIVAPPASPSAIAIPQ